MFRDFRTFLSTLCLRRFLFLYGLVPSLLWSRRFVSMRLVTRSKSLLVKSVLSSTRSHFQTIGTVVFDLFLRNVDFFFTTFTKCSEFSVPHKSLCRTSLKLYLFFYS